MARLMRRSVQRHGDRECLVDGDRRETYRSFWDKVCRVRGYLGAHGVGVGDRVLIQMSNSADFVVAQTAVMAHGAVCVAAKEEYREVELDRMLDTARPTLALLRRDDRESLGELWEGRDTRCPVHWMADAQEHPDPSPSEEQHVSGWDPAAIVYSCWGDGALRGAVHSHRGYAVAGLGFRRWHALDSNDRVLVVLPMPHIFTLSGTITSGLAAGACLVVGRSLTPRGVFRQIMQDEITFLVSVPALFGLMHRFWKPDRFDLSRIRHFVTGGAHLPADVNRDIQDNLGVTLVQGYGLTECFPLTSEPPTPERGEQVFGAMGVPGDPNRVLVRVSDPDTGEILPDGETGELEICSVCNMLEYVDDPVRTAEVLREGNWLRTGDLGRVDDGGHLWFERMIKPIINFRGNKVDPLEAANVLEEHAGVARAEVFAHDTGEPTDPTAVGARVQAANPAAADDESRAALQKDIAAHARRRMAGFKVPTVWEWTTP